METFQIDMGVVSCVWMGRMEQIMAGRRMGWMATEVGDGCCG